MTTPLPPSLLRLGKTPLASKRPLNLLLSSKSSHWHLILKMRKRLQQDCKLSPVSFQLACARNWQPPYMPVAQQNLHKWKVQKLFSISPVWDALFIPLRTNSVPSFGADQGDVAPGNVWSYTWAHGTTTEAAVLILRERLIRPTVGGDSMAERPGYGFLWSRNHRGHEPPHREGCHQ